jgi:Arc/MetJ-type ribon-helix-helix transcriptional regulator
MRQKERGITSMAHEITVCFRFGKTMDQRINRILGQRYPTRSKFIRAAIEHLLSKEEAQIRLRAAQQTLHWG